jgi:hypothetical protein
MKHTAFLQQENFFMTQCLALFTVLLGSSALCATALKESEPRSLWEEAKSLKTPESAYYEPENQWIFVSSVAGDPKQTDGNGWISKLNASGKLLAAKWVQGLNAPKGMRSADGYLWVSDIHTLLKIDIKSGVIVLRVTVPSARFLNDVAIGPEGEIYVSDTLSSRIYEYRNSQIKIFAEGENLASPNGLLVREGKLIVAAWGLTSDFANTTAGRLYSIDLKTKEQQPITPEAVGNLDGLEWDGEAYLVSDWVAGKVFRISTNGQVTPLLSGFKGAADIGWLSDSRSLLVPRMGEDRLTAYSLKQKN